MANSHKPCDGQHEYQCDCHTRIQVNYISGGKYCRRCEYYFFTERLFCECYGMRLRASPANKVYKEKVRSKRKLIAVELSTVLDKSDVVH